MLSKHKYINLIIIIIYFIKPPVFSQEYFNKNHTDNLFYVNPSYIQVFNTPLLNLNYRNQYPFTSYINYNVGYFHPVEDLNSNFGIIMQYETKNQNVFTNWSGAINYSYKVQISRYNYLSAGIRGSYHQSTLDYSRLTFETPNGYPTDQQRIFYPDFNFGFSLVIKEQNTFSAGVNHILEPTIASDQRLNRQFSFAYISKYRLRSSSADVFIEPVFVSIFSRASDDIYYGGNFYYSAIIGGILLHQNLSFNFSSLSVLLGFSSDKYKIMYNYDINLSGLLKISHKMAAHEVTFLTTFKYKERRKKRKAIKCPRI